MSSTAQNQARVELASAIAALRSREVPFVDGVRRVLALRVPLRVPDFDPDFMVLVAIDSESDHLPNSHARLMSSDAWLKKTISEERELEELHGREVMEVCERLLVRFAGVA